MKVYAILDTGLVPEDRLLWAAERALVGGARLLQLRAKDWDTPRRVELLRRLKPLCRRHGAQLIVDDDHLAALEAGVGLHLGDQDLPLPEARKLLPPETIIGRTCSGDLRLALWAQEAGASYVAMGPVYPTPTKPQKPTVGLRVLAEAVKLLAIPAYAIGGINPRNVREVMKTGVAGVAAIRAIFGAGDPAEGVRALLEAAQDISRL